MKAEQPKRLGRGLAALMGNDAVPVSVAASGVQNLGVADLEPSPYQPRREMDETALSELADSITQRGILQPLLVRPHPEQAGRYQIIAGERRWRAAQKARLHEVPVLVRDLSDNDAMAAGLVENLQREDLNAVEEAMGYQRLITEFKMTQDTLAEALGKSRGYINNIIRLLKLPEKVLTMVRDGSLTQGHARALLTHADPLKGARLIVEKGMSVRQAEQYVNDLGKTFKGGLLNRPPPEKTHTDDTDALAERLSESLGLKVKITFNGKSGAVTLNYADLDQLESILKLLEG
jgi:ParB family chromosome partitioning protein